VTFLFLFRSEDADEDEDDDWNTAAESVIELIVSLQRQLDGVVAEFFLWCLEVVRVYPRFHLKMGGVLLSFSPFGSFYSSH
jgi:hypothetical protein